jgi:hypothetical protein
VDPGSLELTLPPSGTGFTGFKIWRDSPYADYNGEVEVGVDGKKTFIKSDFNLPGTRNVITSAQLRKIKGSSD